MSDLIDRLRGKYAVGPDGEFGTRDFSEFIPAISLEAADEIERLQAECERLRDLVKKSYWEGVETQYSHSGPLHILTAWSASSVKDQLQEVDGE